MLKRSKVVYWRSAACLLLAAGTLCACTKPQIETPAEGSKKQAEITVLQPVVNVRTRKDELKNSKAAPADHETARTDWAFKIDTELDYHIADEKNDLQDKQNGYHIWIDITGVRLKLALPITTQISHQAPKYVFEHENGHVKICRRIYADARKLATEAATKVFEKRFEGFGKDQKMALSNALQFAGQELAAYYRVKTAGEAEKVSSKYDQICLSEDRKEQVDKTIEDAFAAVDAEEKAAPQK